MHASKIFGVVFILLLLEIFRVFMLCACDCISVVNEPIISILIVLCMMFVCFFFAASSHPRIHNRFETVVNQMTCSQHYRYKIFVPLLVVQMIKNEKFVKWINDSDVKTKIVWISAFAEQWEGIKIPLATNHFNKTTETVYLNCVFFCCYY